MFLIRHICVSYPTCFLNDIFCSTTYYTKQHIFFNNMCMFLKNILMFLNNICMSYNIIGHMYVMYRLTTYMWSLCNIFLYLSAAITPFVALSADQSVVQWACQFIVSSKHLNCTMSSLFFQRDDVFYLLCTRAWRVLLLSNTQRQLWHLGWYMLQLTVSAWKDIFSSVPWIMIILTRFQHDRVSSSWDQGSMSLFCSSHWST